VPDGKVGHDAYAVIRETIRSLDTGPRSRRSDQSRAPDKLESDVLMLNEPYASRQREVRARGAPQASRLRG
jgi:hypothetical protein